MSKRTWTDEQLIQAAKDSDCLSDIIKKLGLKLFPGNYKTLYVHLDRLHIDRDHWVKHRLPKHPCNKMDLKVALVEDSPYRNNNTLKKRLLNEDILQNVCASCGLSVFWNNKPITLRLDHINGISRDNRLENLRLLCPNCDSQTSTYAGRNINNGKRTPEIKTCVTCGIVIGKTTRTGLCRKCSHPAKQNNRVCEKEGCNNKLGKRQKRFCSEICANSSRRLLGRPNRETLAKDIQENSWLSLGKKYNVSDNAIRKWAKQYGLI